MRSSSSSCRARSGEMGRRPSDQGRDRSLRPYVQFGAKKYASLKKEDDPYTITLERAREVIREKQEIEANRIIREFPEAGIQVLEWPLRPVHQRRQEERQDSEGSRSEVADARRMQGAPRGSAGTHRWTLGSQDRGPACNAGGARRRQRRRLQGKPPGMSRRAPRTASRRPGTWPRRSRLRKRKRPRRKRHQPGRKPRLRRNPSLHRSPDRHLTLARYAQRQAATCPTTRRPSPP